MKIIKIIVLSINLEIRLFKNNKKYNDQTLSVNIIIDIPVN